MVKGFTNGTDGEAVSTNCIGSLYYRGGAFQMQSVKSLFSFAIERRTLAEEDVGTTN